MNLKMLKRKCAVPAMTGAAALLLHVFSAAAQSTNGTDFASFQVIGQRNIFDPNRVPHRPFTRSVTKVVDSFSFVGTMSYAKGNFAFFDGTSADFRKVLELDGEIAGFKVTAITPKSVKLLSGTNETVLDLGTQMRRDDDGHWVVSTETASYGGGGNSFASGSGRGFSNRRRYYNYSSGRNNFQTTTTVTTGNSPADNPDVTAQDGMADSGADTNAPDMAPPPGGGANDALTRLMQQRAQEEQQLGPGR